MSQSLVSCIYRGTVSHRRIRPRAHYLNYRIWSMLIDLDELEIIDRSLRLFSVDRMNVVSFFVRDRGDGSSRPLRVQVESRMQAMGLNPDGGPIRLLTMPRVMGFTFNPLSIYFCHRCNGTLSAILWEVDNTFGERHGYLLPAVDYQDGYVLQSCSKQFYVSPFMEMQLTYEFKVQAPSEKFSLTIKVADADGPILVAVHNAKRVTLSDSSLLRVLFDLPFVTLKVWIGIHLEAAKMLMKGLRIKPRSSHVSATENSTGSERSIRNSVT